MNPADRLTCAHAGIAALRRQAAALELQRTAARIRADRARRVDLGDRLFWRVVKIGLAVMVVIYGLILIAHAAPIAAHSIAFPATIQH